jgi:starch phosphorylase
VALDPDRPTIGFARRMTGYKRPDLLFADLEKLQAINERLPFQIVVAGKAHPRDEGGKETHSPRSEHPERARPEGAGARRVPAELRYGARRPLDRRVS